MKRIGGGRVDEISGEDQKCNEKWYEPGMSYTSIPTSTYQASCFPPFGVRAVGLSIRTALRSSRVSIQSLGID